MQFGETSTGEPTTRMIVASPWELVVTLPQKPLTKPTPILNAPMHAVHEHSLVGNVSDMLERVVATLTMSAEIGRHENVADVMTGFGVESRVGCKNGY